MASHNPLPPSLLHHGSPLMVNPSLHLRVPTHHGSRLPVNSRIPIALALRGDHLLASLNLPRIGLVPQASLRTATRTQSRTHQQTLRSLRLVNHGLTGLTQAETAVALMTTVQLPLSICPVLLQMMTKKTIPSQLLRLPTGKIANHRSQIRLRTLMFLRRQLTTTIPMISLTTRRMHLARVATGAMHDRHQSQQPTAARENQMFSRF